jgi:uncharacterized coiled-coil DUF342 family protein
MGSMASPTLLEQKIEELNQQLAHLRQERDQLNQEAKKWVEKRNQNNLQIKQLQTEAKSIKAKRDEINLQVQILKAARERAKTQRQEKHDQAAKLMEKMKPIAERKSASRFQELEKRIQDIDWKIQTSSLPIQEEKELVEKVKELETQKTSHKRFLKLKDKLVEAQIEAKAFGTQARLKHDELSQLAKQSQEAHTQFLDTVDRIKPLRQSANEAHQKCLELRQKANTTHEKYVEIQRQIKSLKEEMTSQEKQQYAQKGQALKDQATARAREKMKRGEKLTLDEFKLLSEEEDATQH